MKKIQTLFEREYVNHKVVCINPVVISGMEWVLEGEGEAVEMVMRRSEALYDKDL